MIKNRRSNQKTEYVLSDKRFTLTEDYFRKVPNDCTTGLKGTHSDKPVLLWNSAPALSLPI